VSSAVTSAEGCAVVTHHVAMADQVARLLEYENEHGYVRVRLTLTSTEDGSRRPPIASGYRSCWDVSQEGDQSMLTDAPLLIEGAEWLDVGPSAIARLHPLFPKNWADVGQRQVLGMYEGARRVGVATVLEIEITLRDH
jgi:hypothetical protein